ncbi:MAG: NUDIX hydrolase, partial [Candidatus Diapherotrites archaeon]|nr:NUDIX hydrolase [Candidatus Diapherotrites archaeon]
PEHWTWKHEALLQDNVSKSVKKAIAFTTMPWVVGRAIVVDGKGKMVVLKGGRGANKGIYMTPGGILSYGETSQETALRECLEEAGLESEVVKFLGVNEGLKSDGQQLFVFFYLAKPIAGELKPNMDDSVEAFWMPIKEALEKFDYYAFEFFKKWIKENPNEAKQLIGFSFDY